MKHTVIFDRQMEAYRAARGWTAQQQVDETFKHYSRDHSIADATRQYTRAPLNVSGDANTVRQVIHNHGDISINAFNGWRWFLRVAFPASGEEALRLFAVLGLGMWLGNLLAFAYR